MAKKKQTGRQLSAASRLKAIVYHTLERFGKKTSVRGQLTDGSAHDVELHVSGTVDGKAVSETIVGALSIGHPTTYAKNNAMPAARLVAHLLSEMPATRREHILAELPDAYASSQGVLPFVEEELIERAAGLIKRLNYTQSETRKGAVSFRAESLEATGAA